MILAGWAAGIAFVAGLGGFWLIMLFGLGAYALVVWAETADGRHRRRPPRRPAQRIEPERAREHFLRRAG